MRSEDSLLLLRADGSVAWANEAAEALLGYTPGEIRELTLAVPSLPTEIRKGNDLPLMTALREMLDGKISQAEGHARFPDKKNGRIAAHWRIWLLETEQRDGRILLALSEIPPESPEGRLPASYRDLFENSVEGIFRSSLDGRILDANPALARIHGYESAAALIENVENIGAELYVRPSRRDQFVKQMLADGSVSGFETEIIRLDKTVRWVAVHARTVYSPDGKPLYFEGSAVDVTDRKRSEQALRLSEERFRLLAESTKVVPFEFDREIPGFTYLGPQASALFGRQLTGVLSLAEWELIVHPDDREEGTRLMRRFGSGEVPQLDIEFRAYTGGGESIWVKQMVDRSGEPGRITKIRGFFLDVTEAKVAEEEKERSRRQLREFAERCQQVREEERTTIAREIHDDMGQALTLFRLDLDWLLRRAETVESTELKAALTEKLEGSHRLLETTMDTMRRILSALRPPLLDECGLKEAIEFQVLEFSKRAGMRCDLNLNPVSVLPESHSIAVFRIFQEILTNTARHAKASRIGVTLREAANDLILSVQDNGRGFSREALQRAGRFGLLGIQERAVFMGGEVEIQASPRSGTLVTLKVPIPNL